MGTGLADSGEPRRSGSGDANATADANADAALAKMGYKGELPRHLGMMSVLGLYVLTTPSIFYPLFLFSSVLRELWNSIPHMVGFCNIS